MKYLKRSLIFGLVIANGCVSNSKKKEPVYVKPIIIEFHGQNLVCHLPEDYEKIMLNSL